MTKKKTFVFLIELHKVNVNIFVSVRTQASSCSASDKACFIQGTSSESKVRRLLLNLIIMLSFKAGHLRNRTIMPKIIIMLVSDHYARVMLAEIHGTTPDKLDKF